MLDATTEPNAVDPQPNGDSGSGRDLEAELKAARAEAAKYRVERNEYKKQVGELSPAAQRLQEIEDANKSEMEKLANARDKLQQQLLESQAQAQLATKRQTLTTLAAQQGINPAVLQFLDVNAFDLENQEATTEALKAFAVANKPNGGPISNPSANGNGKPAESAADRRARLLGGGVRTIFEQG